MATTVFLFWSKEVIILNVLLMKRFFWTHPRATKPPERFFHWVIGFLISRVFLICIDLFMKDGAHSFVGQSATYKKQQIGRKPLHHPPFSYFKQKFAYAFAWLKYYSCVDGDAPFCRITCFSDNIWQWPKIKCSRMKAFTSMIFCFKWQKIFCVTTLVLSLSSGC